MINLHPLCHYANSTHYAKLYPQNGERVVTTDSVTSFHPVYNDGAFQTDEAPTLASFAESASASGVVVGRTMRSSTICQTIVTHVTVWRKCPPLVLLTRVISILLYVNNVYLHSRAVREERRGERNGPSSSPHSEAIKASRACS